MFKLCAGAHLHRNYNYICAHVYTVKLYKALEIYEMRSVTNDQITHNIYNT